jgi:hypothetical protein
LEGGQPSDDTADHPVQDDAEADDGEAWPVAAE